MKISHKVDKFKLHFNIIVFSKKIEYAKVATLLNAPTIKNFTREKMFLLKNSHLRKKIKEAKI